jgi:hypothetical protein
MENFEHPNGIITGLTELQNSQLDVTADIRNHHEVHWMKRLEQLLA